MLPSLLPRFFVTLRSPLSVPRVARPALPPTCDWYVVGPCVTGLDSTCGPPRTDLPANAPLRRGCGCSVVGPCVPGLDSTCGPPRTDLSVNLPLRRLLLDKTEEAVAI